MPQAPHIPRVIYPHRSMFFRAWQAMVLWHLRTELAAVESERQTYEASGWVGPEYIANCRRVEQVLRVRIAVWEAK